MKNIIRNLAIAAALTAGINHAQNLTAEVPFTFSIPGATMPSGTYEFARHSTGHSFIYYLRNAATGQRALLPAAQSAPDRGAGGKLMFRCVAEGCMLSEVHPGQGLSGQAIVMSTPKKDAEGVRIAAVPLVPQR